MFGMIWMVVAPWKGGDSSLKLFVELTMKELLLLLTLVAAAIELSK
ncbi:MAG: hypothetical protein K0R39_3455 [Symbiobacteriaceae bacterium]|jgi:hypothetical protein|nr:hypothetical protein [Symbiobacteriaceae bacterium]